MSCSWQTPTHTHIPPTCYELIKAARGLLISKTVFMDFNSRRLLGFRDTGATFRWQIDFRS